MRHNVRKLAILAACAASLQACTQYVVAAKSPSDVLTESPHSVRVTMNDGKTLELGRPVVRNGFVVELRRDSVRVADVRQVEVPKLDRRRTTFFVLGLVVLSVVLGVSQGSSSEPDDGASPIVPVLLRWP